MLITNKARNVTGHGKRISAPFINKPRLTVLCSPSLNGTRVAS